MQRPLAIYDPLSTGETVPYGIRMFGPDLIENPHSFKRLIEQDHGLDRRTKKGLIASLNSPEILDTLLSGAAGYMLAKTVSSYSELSKPARTLLSLAGFGVGNIIYNNLKERKFTNYDPSTGRMEIKL